MGGYGWTAGGSAVELVDGAVVASSARGFGQGFLNSP